MSFSADISRTVERPTILRHLVLLALLVITMINYVQRNCIGVASTTIQDSLGLDLIEIGAAMGSFFLFYTIAMIPSGLVAQWLGGKWALVLFAIGWSAALAASAFSQTYLQLYWGRALLGVFQAGIFPCATLILQAWYPATRRGLATSLLNSFMLIGGVLGAMLTGRLLGMLNSNENPEVWRQIFIAFAVPGVLWALWFAWWFRNRPENDPRVNQAELSIIRGPTSPPGTSLPTANPTSAPVTSKGDERVTQAKDSFSEGKSSAVLLPSGSRPTTTSRNWVILLVMAIITLILLYTQQGFRAGANRLFDSWMPTFYQQERALSKEMAAYLSAFLQAMGVVGGLVGGMLSDEVLRRTGSLRLARNGVALLSLLGSVALYVAAYPIANVYLSTLVFGMGVFVFCFSSPCAYALTMDVGGRNLAIIFSGMNTIGNLGAYVFVAYTPQVILLGERHWGEGRGWDLLLLVFVGMNVAAAVCWVFLNPNATIDRALESRRSET